MLFKIDENMPLEAVELLHQAGHLAHTVFDEQLAGHPDSNVAATCQVEQRVLITLDVDFADIRVYSPAQYAGLVVLRPRIQAKPTVLALLSQLIPQFDLQPVNKTLWIVTETGIRIRGDAG